MVEHEFFGVLKIQTRVYSPTQLFNDFLKQLFNSLFMNRVKINFSIFVI